METIQIPERIHDNFGDGINRFFRLVRKVRALPEEEEVTLDMRQCRFLTPFFLLPLFLFVRKERQRRIVNILMQENEYSCASYLRHICFETGLKPEIYQHADYSRLMEEYGRKTYIPIIDFPADRRANNTDMRDQFLSTINNLLTQQVALGGNFKTGIMYLIDETINNVVDHSQEERGFIFAQYFRTNGYIDICVGDGGIGILGSYQQAGRSDIATDRDAVIKAANGVSTKNRPEAEGRGFGISTSLNMLVNGLRGKYFLLSGTAFLIKTLATEEVVTVPDSLHWPGTIVALRVPYVSNIDFNAADYYA